ncbi:MAG TPA: hypothetical protein VFP66_14790 [Candidatus Limnocylindrales bacterium]|nr:hypothetical protein [Candidatus Limnocylindrales bacterium]
MGVAQSLQLTAVVRPEAHPRCGGFVGFGGFGVFDGFGVGVGVG